MTLFTWPTLAFQTLFFPLQEQARYSWLSPSITIFLSTVSLRPLIGFFCNSPGTLHWILESLTFRDNTGTGNISSHRPRNLPFEKLNCTAGFCDLSHNPLFQVVLPSVPPYSLGYPDYFQTHSEFDVQHPHELFFFLVWVCLWEQGMDDGLWEGNSLERLVALWHTAQIYKNTGIRYYTFSIRIDLVLKSHYPRAGLPLLSAAGNLSFLVRWIKPNSEYSDRLYHQLFEVQAAEHSMCSCLCQRAINLREVERRANQPGVLCSILGVTPGIFSRVMAVAHEMVVCWVGRYIP